MADDYKSESKRQVKRRKTHPKFAADIDNRQQDLRSRFVKKPRADENKRPRRERLSPQEKEKRTDFVVRLLDRGATRQQVIEALTRPPSEDPKKPGGLGLARNIALNTFNFARQHRQDLLREESKFVRSEQYHRLKGHISGAVQDKQFGAVAQLERGVSRLMGTDAIAPTVSRGDRRDLIADALAAMTDEEIETLAGDDDKEDS